ncbi:MAG: DUF1844 domain-containing protein [Dissulfurispiraceae bacterium]|jgi:hypothetical protein|nr:DUF1844 domain-containing protein [Dissulfurispiraceae bacterium]
MEKDFEVRDKRTAAAENIDQEPVKDKKEKNTEAAPEKQAAPLPEASFMTHMMSISSMAYMCMGMGPDSGQSDPEQAKYFIDTLGMLEEKTKGNLLPDEQKILTDMLYSLRMSYVKMTEQKD